MAYAKVIFAAKINEFHLSSKKKDKKMLFILYVRFLVGMLQSRLAYVKVSELVHLLLAFRLTFD